MRDNNIVYRGPVPGFAGAMFAFSEVPACTDLRIYKRREVNDMFPPRMFLEKTSNIIILGLMPCKFGSHKLVLGGEKAHQRSELLDCVGYGSGD